ncbi:hypothetical protein MHB42_20235 [Lysinibacillus sp. FSL K6-0232]|uniref:hypothetical protein n=1 Tax=Lysinibacillus sp. FSL K6-0232 TaxID=2921425 RepID=UPI0030FBAC44
MLIKYDLQIYKAEKRVFFMFIMDHSIEFVEKFVSDFYGIDQCKRIDRHDRDISNNNNLRGKYYDSNNLHQLSNPKFFASDNDFLIVGESVTLDFQVHDYNLKNMIYKEFVNIMRECVFPKKCSITIIFCSSEDEHNRARYAGGTSSVFCKRKVQRIATKNTEHCHPIFSLFSRQRIG